MLLQITYPLLDGLWHESCRSWLRVQPQFHHWEALLPLKIPFLDPVLRKTTGWSYGKPLTQLNQAQQKVKIVVWELGWNLLRANLQGNKTEVFHLKEQSRGNVYWANTHTAVQITDPKTDRLMDGAHSEKCYVVLMSSCGCGQQGSESEWPYMGFFSHNLSTLFPESLSHLHSHTPILSGAHIHKRGWAKACTRNLFAVHPFCHLVLPVTYTQLSTSPSGFCSSSYTLFRTKAWFIQLPGFDYRKRAREGGTQSTLTGPAAPFGFSTTEHRLLLPFSEMAQENPLKSRCQEEMSERYACLHLAVDVWSSTYFSTCFSFLVFLFFFPPRMESGVALWIGTNVQVIMKRGNHWNSCWQHEKLIGYFCQLP